jgi:hypothetical protein
MYHKIALFSTRTIHQGDELTIDYRWDESELGIPEDVYCLCEKEKCRVFLMRAKKSQSLKSRDNSRDFRKTADA